MRAYMKYAITPEAMPATINNPLRIFNTRSAELAVDADTRLLGVGNAVGVGELALVGTAVGSGVELTVFGTGDSTVIGFAIAGALPASGGIFKTMPTRRPRASARLFALIISGYLVPSPYTFCAMVHGLSLDCTV